MANQWQVWRLKLGAGGWNKWRDNNSSVEINLSGVNLSGVALSKANLSGANLKKANLKVTKLTGANLSEADLSGAKLKWVRALGTNFSGANFTGACIEDWNINSDTNFENVICDYIYLKEGQKERRPADPKKNFEPGEFAALVQEYAKTVDLIFKDGIDWKAFLSSYQDLRVEYGEQNVSIQAIEKKSDGAFVIRLSVPLEADKAKMETSFWQIYRPILQAKDEQIALYGQVLEDKRKENTRLIGIIQTMAERDDTFLNQHQINILKTINSGIFKSTDIAKALDLEEHLVKYYLEEFDILDFIRGSRGFENGWREYRICQLSHKGQVALQDQNLLVKESSMSNTVNNNLQGANIGNFANEVKDNARQQTNQYNYTIGQNIDEIKSLILSLREAIQQFPEEEREDAEMEIDDLEAEIVNPEKQDPKRFGRRLKRLAVIGTTVATLAGGAVKLSENANTFTDNVIELGEKLEAPVQIIKDNL